MGDRIVLRTACRDNGEAIAALANELEQGDLVLSSDHPVETGAWVAFEVLLGDGQSFFEGMGRCVRSRTHAGRHHVRLDDLQLDTAGELLFERIVMAREDLDQGGRQTGEIDIARLAEASGVATTPMPPRPAAPAPALPPALPGATAPASTRPRPPTPPIVAPPKVPLPPKPASALPPKPASALPPKPASVPRPLSAPPPKPASALPPSPLSAPPPAPASALPPRPVAPLRPPSVAPRPRPPSVVPTSPGGLAAVKPGAVRAPSVAPSGLPPAPRVPTFAPRPFAPSADDDTRVSLERPPLEPSDTTVSQPPAVSSRASARAPSTTGDALLDARLSSLLPRLVAEGRVRDLDELRLLAIRIGLDALDAVYPES